MVGVTNGHGQGIGSVSVIHLRAGQENGDHYSNLLLVGFAGADHGFFHEPRGVLGDGQPGRSRSDQSGATCEPQLQRAIGILVDESLLDRGSIRLMVRKDYADPIEDRGQPFGHRQLR